MTPEYLEENTKRVIDELYTYPKCFKRILKSIKVGLINSIPVTYVNLKRKNEYHYFYKS